MVFLVCSTCRLRVTKTTTQYSPNIVIIKMIESSCRQCLQCWIAIVSLARGGTMHNYISPATMQRRSIIFPRGLCKCTAYIPLHFTLQREDKEHLNPSCSAATVLTNNNSSSALADSAFSVSI